MQCVPVVPSSVYEHTLVARPNFQLRQVCRGELRGCRCGNS